MIAQDQLTPTSYTATKAPSFVSGERPNGPIGPFLKEAVQILIQAIRTVSTPHYNNNNNTSTVINPTTTSYHDTTSHNAENTTDTQRRHQQREDSSGDTVTWKLNLTPTLMTLDTNIQTVAGLVQVLGQLFANVDPQPILTNSSSSSSSSSSSICSASSPPPSTPSQPFTSNSTTNVSSDQYQMYGIIHAIGEALRLSQVLVIPQTDVFRQVNTIQLMKQCVQVFIMCDNGAFFMNVPDLMSKTDLVLTTANLFSNNSNNNNNDNGNDGEHALDTLLLLSICCMMVRHVMVHRRGHTAVSAGLAHAFYSHARVRLQELFDVPHITVLRSIFLLSGFPHGPIDLFSTARLSSTLLTSATRMTLAMNLHHLDDTNSTEDLDMDEKERRRRLAWMILCADHFSSMNRTGHSGLIDVNQWHVDFPSTLQDEQHQPSVKRRVELFSQYCRIVMIRKMELFRSAYMVVSQSNKALASSMDQKLFDTYTSTPEHLRLTLDLDNDQHLTRQWTKQDDLEPLLLESLHCNSLIMALVPFLPRRYLATFEQGAVSREAGIKDIYQLMKHQASVSNCSISPPPPPTPFYNSRQRNHPSTNNNNNEEEDSIELEMHTVINCLTAANRLSLILEILEGMDPMYCHHQPTHPALLLAYVYDMIQTNCQHSKVAMLCRLNLIRLQRLVRQTRLIDPDLTLVYLERILTSYISSTNDDPSRVLERTTASILSSLRQQHALDESIKSEPVH